MTDTIRHDQRLVDSGRGPTAVPDLDPVLDLDPAERAEVAALADALGSVEPALVDDPVWIAACRESAGALPQRLRTRLREYRRDPGTGGVLLLRGLPFGDDLPPTPIEPESVERHATPAASALAMVASELGEPIAFRDEKQGALVQNVVPVPEREREQSNAGSTPLELHVENAFHPRRPDLVALMCLRAGGPPGAGLRVASVRRAVRLLTAEQSAILRSPRFVTEPPPSFGDAGDGAVAPQGVLTGEPHDPDACVDFHATRAVDPEAEAALSALRARLEEVTETLVLQPGELALVDNRVALHGRTAYTPSYDGTDRWLHRGFVHLDHRRSRPMRSPNGNVLR